MEKLKKLLSQSKNLVILTGAGVSAESGIPTFRGSEGFWRKYRSQSLATPEAFQKSPSLVWEFYEYRRELVLAKHPNKAHISIAEYETFLKKNNRNLTVITQNVDGLHIRAGSKNVIELHGSLFKTRCTVCDNIEVNFDNPICPALEGRCAPDVEDHVEIPVLELPRCKNNKCNGLLRPHIVWFGESLDPIVMHKTEQILNSCDLCLVIGTSSVVYPAASFAPELVAKGVPIAEFNLETTPHSSLFQFHFEGPCSKTVSEALSLEDI